MSESKFEFDEQIIKKLNDNCAKVDEHNYFKFLNANVDGENSSISYFLKGLIRNLSFEPNHKDKKINLTKDEQIKLVIEFYKGLDAKTGELVEQILTGKHADYKTQIGIDETLEHTKGNVGSGEDSAQIEVEVILNGTLDGPITIAHEAAHAISAHHVQLNKLETVKEKRKAAKFLNRYSVDCIGEVESYIIELLFVDFLLEKGVMQKDDYENFMAQRNNNLVNEIFQILQENDVVSHLACPITIEAFKEFEQKIKASKNYTAIMNRCRIMAECKDEHPSFAEYKFRYVVGEVVSTLWFENFKNCNASEQKRMLKTFLDYVTTKTDHVGIEEMMHILLGSNVKETCEQYYDLKKNNTVTV